MIRLRDATMLALTKLRTRKVRLTITVVVSGLLFSGLAGASLVARGIMGGVTDFGKEGLGDRYIAQAYPQTGYAFFSDQTVIDRALAIQKEIIASKKAEAKRLGISYDATNEPSPMQEYDTPDGKQRILIPNHPAAEKAVQEYQASHPAPGLPELSASAKPYKPIATYHSQALSYNLEGAQIQVLKDGQETFGEQSQKGFAGPPTGIDSFVSSWSIMSSGLMQPFILPGQNLQAGADGSIPIIVPFSAAEQLLGLKSLPGSADAGTRLARTKEVREKAPKITFSACYRNATSAQLVNSAEATKQEIERNKGKKDYQKPSLIYGLPTEPCGAVPVTRDVRSKDEKTLAAKQLAFDQLFGAEPAAQEKLAFRIVGIVPDPDYGLGAVKVDQIIRSLVTSSLGNGWYTPEEQVTSNPLLGKLFNTTSAFANSPTYYAEFATADQARTFIEKENCQVDFSKATPGYDPSAECAKAGTPFGISAYGNNSLALESAKKGFGKFFRIGALIVSAIACIIMMGTVGRMIADSRRETAVFRAIGAKKLDIAEIYVIYVICLSLLISLFAAAAGMALALYADHRWSADVTIQAINAYNAQDLSKTFPLYTLYTPDILLLIGLSLAAGLLSAILPLFRNLRRNPIRDMRDDT